MLPRVPAGYVCLASAANNNRRCPLCRQEHILDPDTLKSRRDSFREGYRAWRKGGANGARGEVSGVVTLSGASTNESLQNSMHTGKRSAADLLDCTGGALAENYQPQIKRQFFGDLEAVQKSNPIASPPRDTAAEDMSSIAEVLAMMRTCHKDPAPAAKLRVAAKRRRKSTLAVKRQLTGVMYVLCQAAQMPCIEAVEKNRLPQLGVLNPEGRFALIVKFGREASSIKEMMAVGITAILNALPDSPEREPLKWDTLQRDILWKYQRRIQSDSLYVYQEPSSTTSETIEQYGQEILNALAPRSVDDVLREPLRRYAQGANLEPLAPEMTNLQRQSAAAEAVKLENMFVPEASARCLVPASATGGSQPQAQEKKQQGQQGKDESSVLVCDVPGCTYSTIYRRYLDQHRRGHGAAKPYTCHWPGCTYACSGKGHLVRHIRVHTVRDVSPLPFSTPLDTWSSLAVFWRYRLFTRCVVIRDRAKSRTNVPGQAVYMQRPNQVT